METRKNLGQLSPSNCIFTLVNYQTKLAFAIDSKDLAIVIENAVRLAKTAKAFEMPVILTTIGADTFGGPLVLPLQAVVPDKNPIDCNKLSIWKNRSVSTAIKTLARRKLAMAGLWTNFSVALSAIEAIQAGYEVYIVSDACAELSDADNDMAIRRMIQAGAVPVGCQQILLHLQSYQPPHYHRRDVNSGLMQEIHHLSCEKIAAHLKD